MGADAPMPPITIPTAAPAGAFAAASIQVHSISGNPPHLSYRIPDMGTPFQKKGNVFHSSGVNPSGSCLFLQSQKNYFLPPFAWAPLFFSSAFAAGAAPLAGSLPPFAPPFAGSAAAAASSVTTGAATTLSPTSFGAVTILPLTLIVLISGVRQGRELAAAERRCEMSSSIMYDGDDLSRTQRCSSKSEEFHTQ